MKTNPPVSVAVVIPTKERPLIMTAAVASVYNQTFLPKELVVVGESPSDIGKIPSHGTSGLAVRTTLLTSTRTKNLSGSVNMALTHLLAEDLLAENTYVALLDDDDTWEPEYLERCITLAASQNLDWVITGITRHESEHGPGTKLSIPQALTPSMFFATNPHVQGSNFFIRLSTLLKAGCFDENLQSTTDRDLCVRVLNLGDIKIGFVREYLVHHMAFAGNRLSTPDSPAKHQGLIAFYGKYAPLMLTKERSAFLDRATSVFSCPRSDFESGDKR